jgi:hypothetical protein
VPSRCIREGARKIWGENLQVLLIEDRLNLSSWTGSGLLRRLGRFSLESHIIKLYDCRELFPEMNNDEI